VIPTGNIWVFYHRPRTVKPGVKRAPRVMEFDPAGQLHPGLGWAVGGWLYWPSTEHGLPWTTGDVWISGKWERRSVSEVSQRRKFIMQIVPPKEDQRGYNESLETCGRLRLSQGLTKFSLPTVRQQTAHRFRCGNRRVQAHVGRALQHSDGRPPRPPALTGEAARAAAAEEEAKRTLPRSFDPKDPDLRSLYHLSTASKVSNDGCVCRRPRRQEGAGVYDDGKYITQVWIDRWCLSVGGGCNNGNTAASRGLLGGPGAAFCTRQQEPCTHLGCSTASHCRPGLVRAARHSAWRV